MTFYRPLRLSIGRDRPRRDTATQPLRGVGTIVAVAGGGFRDTPALACFFGAHRARVAFVTCDEVRCVAPDDLEDGGVEYPVTVSNNGNDLESRVEEGTTGAVVFACVLRPEMDNVNPPTLTRQQTSLRASRTRRSDVRLRGRSDGAGDGRGQRRRPRVPCPRPPPRAHPGRAGRPHKHQRRIWGVLDEVQHMGEDDGKIRRAPQEVGKGRCDGGAADIDWSAQSRSRPRRARLVRRKRMVLSLKCFSFQIRPARRAARRSPRQARSRRRRSTARQQVAGSRGQHRLIHGPPKNCREYILTF